MKKVKAKWESAGYFFNSVFILCFKYLMTNDILKIKSLCAISLYANKIQKYNCIKKKIGGGDLNYSKGKELFTLNMFPTNKQNKLKKNEDEWYKRGKLFKLYDRNRMYFLFPYFLFFIR